LTWVKFCGCTSWNDVELAIEAGADAIGMIFAPSPRRIAWSQAQAIARRLPQDLDAVAVFVDPQPHEVDAVRALFPQAWLQFSGNEEPGALARYGGARLKAIHVSGEDSEAALEERAARYDGARPLFDAYVAGMAGGTGRTFAWERVAALARRREIVVAGGLNPRNAGACVRAVRPFGVDVRGGVESDGAKDAAKMRAFVRAVRAADAP